MSPTSTWAGGEGVAGWGEVVPSPSNQFIPTPLPIPLTRTAPASVAALSSGLSVSSTNSKAPRRDSTRGVLDKLGGEVGDTGAGPTSSDGEALGMALLSLLPACSGRAPLPERRRNCLKLRRLALTGKRFGEVEGAGRAVSGSAIEASLPPEPERRMVLKLKLRPMLARSFSPKSLLELLDERERGGKARDARKRAERERFFFSGLGESILHNHKYIGSLDALMRATVATPGSSRCNTGGPLSRPSVAHSLAVALAQLLSLPAPPSSYPNVPLHRFLCNVTAARWPMGPASM